MRLTLGKKLGLGFGCILTLMAVSAVLTYSKAISLKEGQDRIMGLRVAGTATD